MTQEENQIKAIAGKRNPYKVPEGYFDRRTFRLPHQSQPASHKKSRLHGYLIGAAAASRCTYPIGQPTHDMVEPRTKNSGSRGI